MFVLIFSTLRQVSVKVFRSPPRRPSLRAGAGRQVLEVTPASRADVAAVTALLSARLAGEPVVSPESGRVTAQVDDGRQLPEIVRELDDRGIELDEFTLRKPSLDEAFFALTGHRAEDEETPTRDLEETSR